MDFSETIQPFLIMVVIILLLSGLMVLVVYVVDKNVVCPNYAKSVNLEYKYNFCAGGCFVNYQGQWIPSDNLRAGKLD